MFTFLLPQSVCPNLTDKISFKTLRNVRHASVDSRFSAGWMAGTAANRDAAATLGFIRAACKTHKQQLKNGIQAIITQLSRSDTMLCRTRSRDVALTHPRTRSFLFAAFPVRQAAFFRKESSVEDRHILPSFHGNPTSGYVNSSVVEVWCKTLFMKHDNSRLFVALVSRKFVVTAGHCVQKYKFDELRSKTIKTFFSHFAFPERSFVKSSFISANSTHKTRAWYLNRCRLKSTRWCRNLSTHAFASD